MKTKNNKTSWLHIRMSHSDKKIIQSIRKNTTCRNLSEYVRKTLLDQPVIATYRNRSQDDLTVQMAVLNRELNAIGNNLNQVVKKLHSLKLLDEKSWGAIYCPLAESTLIKINEVKILVSTITEQWLR